MHFTFLFPEASLGKGWSFRQGKLYCGGEHDTAVRSLFSIEHFTSAGFAAIFSQTLFFSSFLELGGAPSTIDSAHWYAEICDERLTEFDYIFRKLSNYSGPVIANLRHRNRFTGIYVVVLIGICSSNNLRRVVVHLECNDVRNAQLHSWCSLSARERCSAIACAGRWDGRTKSRVPLPS